jgi:hypothetical protein
LLPKTAGLFGLELLDMRAYKTRPPRPYQLTAIDDRVAFTGAAAADVEEGVGCG